MPILEGTGLAAGQAQAHGYSDESGPGPFDGVGSSAGSSTAQAYSTSEAAGAAAGAATVSGIGSSLSSQGAGSSAGAATVSGAGQLVIVRLSENPKTYLLRLIEVRQGANGVVELEFVREDLAVYPGSNSAPNLSAGSPSGSPEPPPPEDGNADASKPGSTFVVFLDIPQLLSEHDGAGFYAAATGINSGWTGAFLFEKKGSEFIQIAELGQRAVIGSSTTVLAAGAVTLFNASGRTYVFDDTNTVDITLKDSVSELSSVANADLFNGINLAALGQHGRWEILAFGTATQLDARKYRLSHLLRGLKGTEWAIGTHKSGDTFVLLNSALRRVRDSLTDLNVERIFRAVSSGSSIDSAGNRRFTNTGVSLKPLAPVYLRGEQDAGGNRVIRWWRRSRLDGLAGRDGTDQPPLGETSERYEIEILNAGGTAVLRTLSSSVEFAVYSAALQTADFGSVPASLRVCVYQLSETQGRGYSGCNVISAFDAGTIEAPDSDRIYDIYVYVEGAQQSSRRILVAPILRPVLLPAGLALSRGKSRGGNAAAQSIYSLQKNGVQFGTATFAAGQSVATLAAAADTLIDPDAGDTFEVVEPASPDTGLRDVGLAFAGVRVN